MRTTKHEIAVSFEFDHGFETGTTIHRSCLPNFGLVSIRVLSGLLGFLESFGDPDFPLQLLS